MSIIGIGTDIVYVPRMKTILQRHGERFCQRVLHENEQSAYALAASPEAFLAKRFAVKEAVAKALSVGIGKDASLTDIETCKEPLGAPRLVLHGDALRTATNLGVTKTFLSLADEREYAIAYVILTND